MTLTLETRQTPTALTLLERPAGRALRYLPVTAALVDLVAVLAAAGLAAALRDSVEMIPSSYPDVSSTLDVAGPLIVVGWLAVMAALGAYSRDVFGAGPDEYKRIVRGAALTAAVIGIGCYLARFQLSRTFFLLLFVVGLPLLLLGRVALRKALHSSRRRGVLTERVLLSGTPQHVDEIATVLSRESWLGYEVVGALTPTFPQAQMTPGGLPVVGSSQHVRGAVDELQPDVLFLADSSAGSAAAMRQMVWDLEEHDVQVVVAPSVADISGGRVKVRPVGGLPLMHIGKPRTLRASHWAKRAFDVAGSLALIVAFAPVFVFSALAILAHDRGPVLFGHTRIGRNGQEFRCLKFRTMVTDADARLAELRAQAGGALLFKLHDDPRITKPGTWLRRYSLDELPQLFNVLRGDMSLVGPRPQVADEVALYRGGMARRLLVRPGLTGLWQVSGRSDLSVEEAMRLDLYYVDNWSMTQDLMILARTISAVVGKKGAY